MLLQQFEFVKMEAERLKDNVMELQGKITTGQRKYDSLKKESNYTRRRLDLAQTKLRERAAQHVRIMTAKNIGFYHQNISGKYADT